MKKKSNFIYLYTESGGAVRHREATYARTLVRATHYFSRHFFFLLSLAEKSQYFEQIKARQTPLTDSNISFSGFSLPAKFRAPSRSHTEIPHCNYISTTTTTAPSPPLDRSLALYSTNTAFLFSPHSFAIVFHIFCRCASGSKSKLKCK